MSVQVVPDPWSRRQIARLLVGLFEVTIVAVVVGFVFAWLGAMLATTVSRLLGNDDFGTAISVLVWAPAFGAFGAYVALRSMAR
jgi:hypothetical protein